ncbi:MAG: sulfotransferase family protein [Candidatus Woesearchaeota archaeon]
MIFIVGLGRSGTSLLQSILNAHTQIAFLPETHFLRKYVLSGKIKNKKGEAIKNILNNDLNFKRAQIPPKEIIQNQKVVNDGKRLFDNLCQLYLNRKGKKIIGDKDPRNLDYLKQLYKLYPNGKFVHIKRDPRDIIVSRIKASWSSSYPFILHPLIINAQYKKAIKLSKQIKNAFLYEIYYEKLINEPEEEVKKLCNFLDVNYENTMLNYTDSSKELVSENEMDWKKETFKPILKKNYNKWKKYFNNKQIYIIQILCKDIFKGNEYKREKIKPNVLLIALKPFLILLTNIFSILYPLRTKFGK